jgi:secretory phospholipase A2
MNIYRCGIGNNAEDCTDLGEYKETDSCCRTHDMCPFKYTKTNQKHNGFNWNRLFHYTLSHCQCDMR